MGLVALPENVFLAFFIERWSVGLEYNLRSRVLLRRNFTPDLWLVKVN